MIPTNFRRAAVVDEVADRALFVADDVGVVAGEPRLGFPHQHDGVHLGDVRRSSASAARRRRLGARVAAVPTCAASRSMHQLTPFSMPRGKLVEAEPLCGPVGISMFGKPWIIMPRKVEMARAPFVGQRSRRRCRWMSIWSKAPVMASKPVA